MTDTWTLFDRLAHSYDQVIPFFAEFAAQLLDVRLMNIHQLDLPDNSYDLATGGFVIHLVANPMQVLTELRRVLRSGATIALTTPGPCEDHGRWNAFNTIWGEFAATRQPRPGYPDVPPSLRAAGFVDVRTVSIAVHLPVSDPQTCWDFHMSHGFAARVEALSPSDAAEFRRRALAELTRMHQSGGIVVDRGAMVYLASTETISLKPLRQSTNPDSTG